MAFPKQNRLAREKSPYLLQHANNPVDWYPWGDEAFAKARLEDKPIFLSVGYSTCHWCHVMERESFEVESIAGIMNDLFVNIKVDREERPDVDKVYMTALQAMGENGGWPMSMFLTPDLKPFFGGTYFPPENRYGRIGFPELLQRISQIWKNERERVAESANGITQFLHDLPAAMKETESLDIAFLQTCFTQATKNYDTQFGGFGSGPKFPRPVVFNFLLRYFNRTGEPQALDMTVQSLRQMSNGGMYDHLGGGYHRYSVDGEWRVPHFEKMVYDQAQICIALADAYSITGDPFFERRLRETLAYVLRDLTDTGGGFYSAEDADSRLTDAADETGEGAFYIWSKREIDEALGDEARIFNFYYGVEESGNALNDPQHEFTGKNILYVAATSAETAAFARVSEAEVEARLEHARQQLFDIRSRRSRPHLDDKIITAWNGLMISACARAAQALNETAYAQAAERAATFVMDNLFNQDTHTLYRRYRDGEAKFDAYLDDYAFLTQGLIDLYETSFEPCWLQQAMRLTEKQIELFWDEAAGGFFDTTGNDGSILVRMKEQYDGAEPTGNSVAVMNLLRLSVMTDNRDWRVKAGRTLKAFGDVLQKSPFTMPQMAAAFDFSLDGVKQIVIAGRRHDEATGKMIKEIHSRYLPNSVILLAEEAPQMNFGSAGAFLKSISMIDEKPTAYVCENFVCRLPTTDIAKMINLLESESKSSSMR
ncbi:MAG: thioredoxin domain-containing protein [Bacteroidetes bacterium]|nr:thioredoxin domain-containing protein [Bacteroidota bacterium]MCW5897411.1 thioredoxin domain-containing protein [Bacteroidota bacterium]